MLRQWRDLRRLSQLELSNRAGVSPRHLSFVETGRAAPSREMILNLAETLDVPLRMRNPLLLAAGYAPIYPENAWDSPQLAAVRSAVRQVLSGHEPHPALAVDRCWNLVDANRMLGLLTEGTAPELLTPPANVLRVSLHPDGVARRIGNLGEWRAHLLGRLRRQVDATADPDLTALYKELQSYPCDDPEPEVEVPGPGDIVVPLLIRQGDRELAFISTTTVFGTPLDITVAELAIESFFPADSATGSALRAHWDGHVTVGG
jgi:transcriptional regulator with XRE-family HTH domain